MIKGSLAAALDPVIFARALKVEPDPWQAQLLRSRHQRIVMSCARQVGKSLTAGILALHTAAFHPNQLILMVSRSFRQALLLFQQVSGILTLRDSNSDISKLNATEMHFRNGSKVIAVPGASENIRGYSAVSIVIFDEAAYIDDKHYHAVMPMIAVSAGRVLMLSSPSAKQGYFWNAWSKGGEAWERYFIAARDCPRISDEFLDHEKEQIPRHVFAREYDAEFTDPALALVSEEDILASHGHEVRPLITASVLDKTVKPIVLETVNA